MLEVGTDLSDALIEYCIAFNDNPDRYLLGTITNEQSVCQFSFSKYSLLSHSLFIFLTITESALEKIAEVQRYLDDLRKKAVLYYISNTIQYNTINQSINQSIIQLHKQGVIQTHRHTHSNFSLCLLYCLLLLTFCCSLTKLNLKSINHFTIYSMMNSKKLRFVKFKLTNC
jgi:hypothetical protein